MKVLSLICACLTANFVAAADWPQWRGPNRNCTVESGTTWPDSLEDDHLTQVWRIPLGPSYSGPVVSGSRVFVTETREERDEFVHALDRRNGEKLWTAKWPGALSVPFFARENGSWIRSTPACDGQRLFVAGIRDVLVCLDCETGTELWRIDFPKKYEEPLPGFGTVCSPLIDGDDVYIQAVASVFRIRRNDGKILWRSSPESGGLFGAGIGASAFSSPVMGNVAGRKQLIVQSRSSLSGYDPNSGERLWTKEVPAFRGMNILTPHVIGDSVFTSTYGGGTFLFDIAAVDGEFQVTERWQTKTQGYMSSPVNVNGQLYLHLRNQRVTCIDPASGESHWTTRPFGKYWSLAVNGDRMLALDQRGKLHLVQANTEEFELKSSATVSQSETWAHLAVVSDELFIRELNAMTVWKWK